MKTFARNSATQYAHSAKQLREWREKFGIADAERQRLQQSLVQAIDGAREQSRLAAEALNSQETRRWQLETEVYGDFRCCFDFIFRVLCCLFVCLFVCLLLLSKIFALHRLNFVLFFDD